MSEQFAMRPSLVWYVGQQGNDNSLTEEPTGPYLCSPPAEVVARCRYAAHLARLPWRGRDLTVLLFVDPATQRFFAQPHPQSAAATQEDWGVADARAARPFTEARQFARRMYAGKDARKTEPFLADWWRDYVAWRKESLPPPPPVDVPADPSNAYGKSGWAGFRDWLLTPKEKKKARKRSTSRRRAKAK